MDPCASDFGCLAAPAEFVRLRYFFGQRLGVVDLYDEQAYLVGKQHFHNLRAHGAGRPVRARRGALPVPAGLRRHQADHPAQGAEGRRPGRVWPRDRSRVGPVHRRGGLVRAASRGPDHAVRRPDHGHPAVDTNTVNLPLWVALCYRECPSDPSPSPAIRAVAATRAASSRASARASS